CSAGTLRHVLVVLLCFRRSVAHRGLRSFPTRRSSDLGAPPSKMRGRKAIARGETFTVTLTPRGDYTVAPLLDFLAMRALPGVEIDRKSTRLNSSHVKISYAVFCLKKKRKS